MLEEICCIVHNQVSKAQNNILMLPVVFVFLMNNDRFLLDKFSNTGLSAIQSRGDGCWEIQIKRRGIAQRRVHTELN